MLKIHTNKVKQRSRVTTQEDTTEPTSSCFSRLRHASMFLLSCLASRCSIFLSFLLFSWKTGIQLNRFASPCSNMTTDALRRAENNWQLKMRRSCRGMRARLKMTRISWFKSWWRKSVYSKKLINNTKMIMSSFMWLHQQTGSGFLSFSGPCLAAVSVVCVAQPVFSPCCYFLIQEERLRWPSNFLQWASLSGRTESHSSQNKTRIHHLCASRTVHSSSKERPTIWKYPNKGWKIR